MNSSHCAGGVAEALQTYLGGMSTCIERISLFRIIISLRRDQ